MAQIWGILSTLLVSLPIGARIMPGRWLSPSSSRTVTSSSASWRREWRKSKGRDALQQSTGALINYT